MPDPRRGRASSPARTDIVPNDPNVVGVRAQHRRHQRPARRRCRRTSSAIPSVPPAAPADHVERQPAAGERSSPTWSSCRSAPTATCSSSTSSARPTSRIDVVGYLLEGPDPSTAHGPGRAAVARRSARSTPVSAQWGAVPLGPGHGRETGASPTSPASVKIGGVRGRRRRARVIGNLTNASLTRQYPSVPVRSLPHRWPGDAARSPTSRRDLERRHRREPIACRTCRS